VVGIEVQVNSSWFIIAALISFAIAPRIEEAEPGLGALKYVAGLVFAVVLYLSVLLHEASHAIMAQRFGFSVDSITLNFVGGMTEIDSAAQRPRQEFWIAVVGPLTSIAVGAASAGLWLLLPDGLVREAVWLLAASNLVMGVLNLVPGLPLDGGRVLKSLVWGASGNATLGTIVAGWGGRLTAIAVLAWPMIQREAFDSPASPFVYLIVIVLGIFLWTGATAAMTHARLRSRIPLLVARPLARRSLAVPGDTPLADALRRAREVDAPSIVTISSSGRPTGIVSESAVLATPEERRPWVATSTVSRTLEDGLTLPATIAGEDLVAAITRRPAEEYLLVEEDGSVMGVLSTADVDKAFLETRA
jgi:Zn-dependent protease